MSRPWKIRLSDAAERDFDKIFLWTIEHFGLTQARRYRDTILDALESLGGGPGVVGARSYPGLPTDIKILPVARKGRRGRHAIVFTAASKGRIHVLRILHDTMDLPRHMVAGPEDSG